jgi:hypothetical protein
MEIIHAEGVLLTPIEPDLESGSTSTRKEYFQVHMGPQDQEVQGLIGCQRTSSDL